MTPAPRKTMFNPAKDKELADIVTFSSIAGAKAAAAELKKRFNATDDCPRKLHIYRAVIQAANRAVAGTKRKLRPVSGEVKTKWLGVAKVYRDLQLYMEEEYAACKQERIASYRRRKGCAY